MIGTTHTARLPYAKAPCGGTFRPARDVTAAEEAEANAHAPAAIVVCDRCGSRVTVEGNNRHRPHTPPDQSVFDVAPAKGT